MEDAPAAELSDGTRDVDPLAAVCSPFVPKIFPKPNLSMERPFRWRLEAEPVELVPLPVLTDRNDLSSVDMGGLAGETETVGVRFCAARKVEEDS